VRRGRRLSRAREAGRAPVGGLRKYMLPAYQCSGGTRISFTCMTGEEDTFNGQKPILRGFCCANRPSFALRLGNAPARPSPTATASAACVWCARRQSPLVHDYTLLHPLRQHHPMMNLYPAHFAFIQLLVLHR